MTSRSEPTATSEDLVETQVERTEMAWARTALACAGLAALSASGVNSGASAWVALVVGGLVAVPGLVASGWRIRGLRAAPQPNPPRTLGVALLAGSVAVVDVVMLVLLAR
jgi:hypothetical protein